MKLLLIAYVLSFILLMFCIYHPSFQKHYLAVKTLTSSIFVLCAAVQMNGVHDWPWLMGFLCCFFGDVLLGIKEKGKPSYFEAGLAAFLFGHIFFIIRMHQMHSIFLLDIVLAFFSVWIVSRLMRLKKMNSGNKHAAIQVYAFVVGLLLAKSLTYFIALPQHIGLVFACFLFLLSDFLLLFIYFYETKWTFMRFINLFFYYSAVLLLTVFLP